MQTIRRSFLLCFTAVLLGAGLSISKAADEKIWNVKAVHPEGRLLDVKAVDKDGKLGTEKVEGKVNGVEFAAHIKALPQAP